MKADPVIQTNGAPVASADSDRYARHTRVAGAGLACLSLSVLYLLSVVAAVLRTERFWRTSDTRQGHQVTAPPITGVDTDTSLFWARCRSR